MKANAEKDAEPVKGFNLGAEKRPTPQLISTDSTNRSQPSGERECAVTVREGLRQYLGSVKKPQKF
jgi:hypothetical protein